MTHIRANWKKYAIGAAAVIVTGLYSLGYLPESVAKTVLGWLGY